jgi:hypothetical protein
MKRFMIICAYGEADDHEALPRYIVSLIKVPCDSCNQYSQRFDVWSIEAKHKRMTTLSKIIAACHNPNRWWYK